MAVVGGGPAGAVVAARTAGLGHDVVLFERDPHWRWRAGGVFASPAALTSLRAVGLDGSTLAQVARPIPAMRVETRGGTTFRLTYGAEDGGECAIGFDRSRLDPALLDLARAAGADVRLGRSVTAVDPDTGRLEIREPDGAMRVVQARVVVGADGPRSIVARAAGVHTTTRLPARIGLTYHVADPDPSACRDARMRVLDDGYVGVAPVAGGRVNVGIVLGRSWTRRLTSDGARTVADSIVATIPPIAGDDVAWATGAPTDAVAGCLAAREPRDPPSRAPMAARRRRGRVPGSVHRRGPVSEPGLGRAGGSPRSTPASAGPGARSRAYERAMHRRFLAKDVVSWLVQLFLSQPRLFEYAARRVAARPDLRGTLGLAMGDLIGAGRVLDPRFLAALLAP